MYAGEILVTRRGDREHPRWATVETFPTNLRAQQWLRHMRSGGFSSTSRVRKLGKDEAANRNPLRRH